MLVISQLLQGDAERAQNMAADLAYLVHVCRLRKLVELDAARAWYRELLAEPREPAVRPAASLVPPER